jgi:hypothetical protein
MVTIHNRNDTRHVIVEAVKPTAMGKIRGFKSFSESGDEYF